MFLNNKIRDLLNISFVRDVGILQIGTIISTALALVASVVFARILGAENYGIYSLIFAFTGLVGIFQNIGSERTCLTLLPEAYAKKDKQEIKNILTYFVKVTFLITITVGLIAIIFAPFFSDLLYHNSEIGKLARWILLANIFGSFFILLTLSLQSVRKIKYLSIIEVINKSFYKLFPILFIILGLGILGIVWGYLLSSILFLFFSFFIYRKLAQRNEYFPGFRQVVLNFNKINFKKYFNFGFLIAIDNNLGNFAGLLPVVFLGIFALPQEVAYFKIAFAYITIPSLLTSSISRMLTVQLPKSKTYSLQILKQHFFKTSLYSGLISVLLVIPFVVLAPYLINLFYGKEFLPSIFLVYYLAILVAISGFSVGLGPIYRTLNKMKITIILNIIQIIFMVLLMLLLIRIFNSLESIVFVMIITSFVFTLLNFYIINTFFKKTLN